MLYACGKRSRVGCAALLSVRFFFFLLICFSLASAIIITITAYYCCTAATNELRGPVNEPGAAAAEGRGRLPESGRNRACSGNVVAAACDRFGDGWPTISNIVDAARLLLLQAVATVA